MGVGMPVVIESSHVDPDSGNLIAWWMVRDHGPTPGELEPVLVTHPYAVFIQWPNEEWTLHAHAANKRIFMLYDNVAKKSYQTRNVAAFLDLVSKLPRDSTIARFDTCTVTRNHMPRELWRPLEEALAEKDPLWAKLRSSDIEEVEEAYYSRMVVVCYGVYEWDFVFPGDRP